MPVRSSHLEIGHYFLSPGIRQSIVRCVCRLRSTRRLDTFGDDFRALNSTLARYDTRYTYCVSLQVHWEFSC